MAGGSIYRGSHVFVEGTTDDKAEDAVKHEAAVAEEGKRDAKNKNAAGEDAAKPPEKGNELDNGKDPPSFLLGQDPPSSNRGPIIGWSPRGTLPRPLKTYYLNYVGSLLGVAGPWRHAWYHCVKFPLWESLCSPSYDNL